MSRRVMIDQIAYDEAVERLRRAIREVAVDGQEPPEHIQMMTDACETLTSALRIDLFNTEHSLIRKQGGQNYEQ